MLVEIKALLVVEGVCEPTDVDNADMFSVLLNDDWLADFKYHDDAVKYAEHVAEISDCEMIDCITRH